VQTTDDAAAPPALTAGRLSAQLAGGDVRQLCWGGREAVARVYVGVRDAEWGTVPANVRLLSERRAGDSFEVRLVGRNAAGRSLAVSWEAMISGSADGLFRFSLVAAMEGPSRYDRIGLCVLHRARYLEGAPVIVRQAGGTAIHNVRPTIEPQWSVDGVELGCTEPCRGLEFTTVGGLCVAEEFEGCEFELEDERNFGDGFLKAYGPPLREGYPREAPAGTIIRQRVTVRMSDAGSGPPARRPARAGPGARRPRRIRVELGSATAAVMPSVGVDYRALPPAPRPARGGQARQEPSRPAADLTAFSPGHLRCDLDLRSPGWRADLNAALRLGAVAGVPLEVAVAVGVPLLSALGELAGLARQVAERLRGTDTAEPAGRGGVSRLLLGAVGGGVPTPAHLAAAERVIGGAGWDVPVFAATAGDVCELIRDRPRYPERVGVAFATNPQVHLTDDEVIFEGLFGQSAAVRTVRELYPAAPLAVSPVTLRPRAGPVEPPPDDPRLAGMCGAAWAAGSVQALAAAGAAAVTFGLPLAGEGAHGVPRCVLHVLAAAAGMSGRPLLATSVENEGLARALGVDAGNRSRLLVANVSPGPLRADVVLPREAGVSRGWMLSQPALPGTGRLSAEPGPAAPGESAPTGRDRRAGGLAGEARPGAGAGLGLNGAPLTAWRPTAIARSGRAFPLRLGGYGIALLELESHRAGEMAGDLPQGKAPVSSALTGQSRSAYHTSRPSDGMQLVNQGRPPGLA
jgi:D-apionolactonase